MTVTSRGAVAPTGEQAGSKALARLDTAALDSVVNDVAAHATSWAKTEAAARAELLQQVITDTMAAEEGWLAAACAAKGLDPRNDRGRRGALRRHWDVRAHGAPAPRRRA